MSKRRFLDDILRLGQFDTISDEGLGCRRNIVRCEDDWLQCGLVQALLITCFRGTGIAVAVVPHVDKLRSRLGNITFT